MMLRFSNTAVGVLQGEEWVVHAFKEGGAMWTGTGSRVERSHVKFNTPFLAAPAIHVGFSLWDVANDANQRLDVAAVDVTAEGFTIEVKTWADTHVARVRVSWLAIGAAPYMDDFEPDLD